MNHTAALSGYTIPHKNFLVVVRHIDDRTSKGKIVKQFDTKPEAESYVAWLKTCGGPNTERDYQRWVIEKEDY